MINNALLDTRAEPECCSDPINATTHNNITEKKITVRETERQRRKQMASLQSLLPSHQSIKVHPLFLLLSLSLSLYIYIYIFEQMITC